MKKRKPLIIGLTGSIGMGKSTAARMLAKKGALLFDADAIVHEALAKGGAAEKKIMRLFPQSVRAGKISRKKLGALVFQDSAKRKKLEAVLHPLVWRARQKKIALAKKKGIDIIVLEIPLLFETGEDKKCDKTLCVSATQKTQKERVFRRSQMTEKKWKAIMVLQMKDREKRKRADFVIRTDKGLADTRRQLDVIWQKIMKETGHA